MGLIIGRALYTGRGHPSRFLKRQRDYMNPSLGGLYYRSRRNGTDSICRTNQKATGRGHGMMKEALSTIQSDVLPEGTKTTILRA